jgi:hypothetical protein
MHAGRLAGTPKGHDLTDFRQPESKPARPGDEGKHREDVAVENPVPGGRPRRRRDDPRLLVQPECFSGYAASGQNFPNLQTQPSHEASLNPAPRGQVKRRIRRLHPEVKGDDRQTASLPATSSPRARAGELRSAPAHYATSRHRPT